MTAPVAEMPNIRRATLQKLSNRYTTVSNDISKGLTAGGCHSPNGAKMATSFLCYCLLAFSGLGYHGTIHTTLATAAWASLVLRSTWWL